MNCCHQNHQAVHDKHADHSAEIFLKKFWLSFILSIPVVAYSEILKELFGWQAPTFPGSEFVPAVLGSVVFFYGGWIFLASAWRELKARLPGMMTLIALAISAAYLWSIYAVLSGSNHTLFWELTTLITIMLLGHWIEMRAVQGAQGALRELSKLLPDKAEVIRNGKTEVVSLDELRLDDIIFVRPGGRIAADGVVIEGESEANESMITGESAPVKKVVGSEVIAGTVNSDGSLKIKVTKIGEHTFLAGVMRLVREAQASKSRLQILSDKAAFYLTLIAILAGGLTFVLWLLAKAGLGFALERVVAVLVIACPHALGLAVPLVASISTTMAARHGFLIRQRLALELARKIDIVLFDKTGTLTKGEYGITRIWAIKNREEDVLQMAASVDSHSEHFISKAIVKKAQEKNIPLLPVKEFLRMPGKGVKGIVAGEEVMVGGVAILDGVDGALPVNIEKAVAEENRKGQTIIYAVHKKEITGIFALADLIREESREAIAALKSMGIKTAMVTGDSEDVAKWVAEELGIDEYFARVLPDKKSEKVKILQNKGLRVAFVGDGINDAPALTQADLGVAVGAGTSVAIESAGIILVKNDPRDIVKIIKLSRLTYVKMLQNLFWATGYNVVAIPLAAGVLAFKGILLQPALAALFMSLSTVVVAVNAMLLRKNRL
jgi:Cu2+-exporting ATPase